MRSSTAPAGSVRATGDPGSAVLRTAAPAGASCRVVFGCVFCVRESVFCLVVCFCHDIPVPPLLLWRRSWYARFTSIVVEALLFFF